MTGYSYFIPDTLRSKVSDDDDDEVGIKIFKPVYPSMEIGRGFDAKMSATDDGRVFFLIEKKHSRGSWTLNHREVCFSNNVMQISEGKSLKLEGDFNLNSRGDVISVSIKDSHLIRVVYRRTSLSSNLAFVKELHCEYSILQYRLYISHATKICIVTCSKDDSFLDILSYGISDESVEIHHDCRVKLPLNNNNLNVFGCNSVLCFSPRETKLFLISFYKKRGPFIVVYLLSEASFGPIYESDIGKWNHYLHYAYHKDIGNVMLICGTNGVVKGLRESNSHFWPLQGGDIDLKEWGFPHCRSYVFRQIDYFSSILIFVQAQNVLYIFDYLERRIVGKFIVSNNLYIFKVQTNWAGQETFVLTRNRLSDVSEFRMNLNVLFICDSNNVSPLKYLAKLALLRLFSLEDLKTMHFPKTLKREMKLLV